MSMAFLGPVHGFAQSLKGYAHGWLTRQGKNYAFDLAVVIRDPRHARFEVLDDFGDTGIRFEAEPGGLQLVNSSHSGKPKKILALPLTEEALIACLLYDPPENPLNPKLVLKRDDYGRITSIRKQGGPRKARYEILYSSFHKTQKGWYPKVIRIRSRLTTLLIEWKDVILL